MIETRDDRREDQTFRRTHNLPKNINVQPKNNKHGGSIKNNNNKKTMSKQKEMFMLVNTLKTVPQKQFTRSRELNISKLH